MTSERLNSKERAILKGSKVLGAIAMPGFALANALTPSASGDAEIAVGLIFTALLWPVTIPSILLIGPVRAAYDKRFDVETIKARERNG